jgi:peptide/nickel transport system substrate-binding protein
VDKVGNEAFNLNPVGSGPYKFKEWQRGVAVTLTVNEAYWGEKGAFATAEFRFVPDPGTRVADLRTGKAEFVYNLDYDMAQTLAGDPNVAPRSTLTERIAFLRPNNGRAPTSNPLIRQAIAYAVDKEGITEGLFGGIDQPTDVMVSPETAGWTEASSYPYDPDKARELIRQAGADAGMEIIFVTSPVYDQRVVQAIQQMLADVGLTVRVDMMDQPSFLKSVQSGPLETRAHLSFGRWSCACMDADGVLYPLIHESSIWSMTRAPELDRELDAARSVIDPAERDKHYKVVNDAIAKEVYLLPLYQCAFIYGVNNRLEWQPTPDESLFLNRMDWK